MSRIPRRDLILVVGRCGRCGRADEDFLFASSHECRIYTVGNDSLYVRSAPIDLSIPENTSHKWHQMVEAWQAHLISSSQVQYSHFHAIQSSNEQSAFHIFYIPSDNHSQVAYLDECVTGVSSIHWWTCKFDHRNCNRGCDSYDDRLIQCVI